MSSQLAKYWITADEFEQMGRAGIFHPDARLELLEGEIYQMSPIGIPHAACVDYLSRFFNRHFGDRMIVRAQNPIRLNDLSEPQPDIALLRWRDDFYRHAHPTPASRRPAPTRGSSAALGFNSCASLLGIAGFLLQMRKSHVRAFAGEKNCHGPADAGIAASDQRYFMI